MSSADLRVTARHAAALARAGVGRVEIHNRRHREIEVIADPKKLRSPRASPSMTSPRR
jgi:hypothetical protein